MLNAWTTHGSCVTTKSSLGESDLQGSQNVSSIHGVYLFVDVTTFHPYRLDRVPGLSYVSYCFLSVLSLCRCPMLFLLRYMFHPSLPQSAVINVLLTRYLSRYL
jgi:hypothetical protein